MQGAPLTGIGRVMCLLQEGTARCSGWTWARLEGQPLREEPLGPNGGWSSIAPGHTNACGIWEDGEMLCWGRNTAEQLGAGVTEGDVPGPVPLQGPWNSVATAGGLTCGIRSHELVCWGGSDLGQNNRDLSQVLNEPLVVPGAWLKASLHWYWGCALNSDGAVLCGLNWEGAEFRPLRPVFVNAEVTDIHVGVFRAVAIDSRQRVWTWSLGESTMSALAADASYLEAAVGYEVCAVEESRRLRCWSPSLKDECVVDGSWASVTLGSHFVCGLRDGEPTCFGREGSLDDLTDDWLDVTAEPDCDDVFAPL